MRYINLRFAHLLKNTQNTKHTYSQLYSPKTMVARKKSNKHKQQAE